MFFTARERFSRWVERRIDAAPMLRFRAVFASIWLLYDVCDLSLSGTARQLFKLEALADGSPLGLRALQVALVVCELGWALGLRPSLAAGLAAGLRLIEIALFTHLNDFNHFAVVAVLLSQLQPLDGKVRAWPREALRLQAGWIYLATAVLKLNPAWLSGDHLRVRHSYLAAVGWPYPRSLLPLLTSVAATRTMALAAVALELLLAAVLFSRRAPRFALALALCIHLPAALLSNVWFFGASMVALVACCAGETQQT